MTVKFTVMFCDLTTTAAPDATIVTFPVYAVVCGFNPTGITVTVNVTGSPGRTTPTAVPDELVTVIQVAPDVAV